MRLPSWKEIIADIQTEREMESRLVKLRENIDAEIDTLRRRERVYRGLAIFLSVVLLALLLSLPLLLMALPGGE